MKVNAGDVNVISLVIYNAKFNRSNISVAKFKMYKDCMLWPHKYITKRVHSKRSY